MSIKIHGRLQGNPLMKFPINIEQWLFPAGEVGARFNSKNYFDENYTSLIVTARLQSSNDIMSLLMFKDALDRNYKYSNKKELILPYIPYGRQDKVHTVGESLSVKVFANLINNLKFDSVTTFDCHSEVTNAVFDNLIEIDRLSIFRNYERHSGEEKFIDLVKDIRNGKVIFVSPDVGANKKVAALAGYFQHDSFIRADKLRELSTGKIKETIVYADDLRSQTCLIADDICEKGGTFIALAQALKKKNAGKIILYVTHGIFSGEKTYQNLFDSGIEEIYTTNSYNEVGYPYPLDKINIINIDNLRKI